MTFKRMGALAVLVAALCLVFALGTAALADGDCGNCTWTLQSGTLTIAPKDGTDGKLASYSGEFSWPWYRDSYGITQVVIEPGVKTNSECVGMFFEINNLISITGLSNLDTSSATNMSKMFARCAALQELDVSSFDTSNVTNMQQMFKGCKNLASLDVSSFDTSKVTTMEAMFSQCKSLTSLDLSSFDTSAVTNMKYMFDGNGSENAFAKITVDPDKWSTEAVTESSCMFRGCTKLVGGAGTTFNSSKTNKEYARVDGGPDSATPGYLTAKIKPGPVPSTGDNTPIALMAGLLLLSGAALIALKKRAAR